MITKERLIISQLEFNDLIAPTNVGDFFHNYWEQRHLAVQRSLPEFYSELPTIFDIDTFISRIKLNRPGAELIVCRREQDSLSYRQIGFSESGTPDVAAVCKAFDEGFTVLLNCVHLQSRQVSMMCKSLEERFRTQVKANLYLTPANAQGFRPHFDNHDAFILQLEGCKKWKIYEPSIELPLDSTKCEVSPQTIGKPLDEITLTEGDMLYIPRGVIHEALTTDTFSLHLTLGVKVFRLVDLLAEMIAIKSESEVDFRKSVSTGFWDSADKITELENQKLQLLELLKDPACTQLALSHLQQSMIRNRAPVHDGHFCSLVKVADVSLNTLVRRRTGMNCLVETREKSAVLTFSGQSIIIPLEILEAVKYLSVAEKFQVKDLPSSLSDIAKIGLTQRLIKDGLLQIELT